MAGYTIQYGDTLSGIAAKSGMSVQQILQANPTIVDANKIYAGRTLALGTPAAPTPAPVSPPPAPVQTPAATPNTKPAPQTIGQVANLSVPDYVQDPNVAQLGQQLKTQATTPLDENAIRAATRSRMQGQIDAINGAVADQIANFRNTTGKNRQGQAYALEAAGGRIGSPTGEAQVEQVENQNDAQAQTYQDEANVKVATLLGQANQDATDEINTKRAAISQGVDKYIQYLDSQSQTKSAQIGSFVKSMIGLGVDPSTLSDADIQKLQDQYGFSRDQLTALYRETKISQTQAIAKNAADLAAEQATTQKTLSDASNFSLRAGQGLYHVDPATGQATKLASQPNIPRAGTTTSTTGAPVTIAPNSPQYKVASDLAYGALTFPQFKSLYSYSKNIDQKLGIYQLASQLNPKFNAADFEAGYDFYKDPAVRKQLSSADNAISNIDNIIDLSNAAARSGVPAVNKILMPAKYQIGDQSVAKFDQAQQLLADEVSGVLGYGSGSDMKLKLGIDAIDGNQDPATFAANMQQLKEFLQKKKDTLISQTSVYGDPKTGGQQNTNQNSNSGVQAPSTYTSSSGKTYYIPH